MSRGTFVVSFLVALLVGAACGQNILSADDDPVGMRLRREALVERALLRKLSETTVLEFIETPLQDIVEYLEDLHECQIELDIRALDSVGIGSDTPVTRCLKGISLRSALNIILRDLELTYIIRDEVLMITTPEEVESRSYTKVYGVKDLADDEQSLNKLVEAVTNAWPENQKGSGAVGFRGTLIANASQNQHDHIERLLGMLRQSMGIERPAEPHPLQGWRPGKSVELVNVPLTLNEIAYLKDHQQIESLDLTGTAITDEGVRLLTELENLRRLNLSQNRLTRKALVHLKSLPKLEHLNLTDARISDEDIAALGMFTGLKHLTVGNVRRGKGTLTYDEVKKLRKALPDCTIHTMRLTIKRSFVGGDEIDPFGDGAKPLKKGADPFGNGKKLLRKDVDPFGGDADSPRKGADPFGGDRPRDPFGKGDGDPFK